MIRYPICILGLLLALELARRLAFTADCYAHLRNTIYPRSGQRAELWHECVERHLYFPFRL